MGRLLFPMVPRTYFGQIDVQVRFILLTGHVHYQTPDMTSYPLYPAKKYTYTHEAEKLKINTCLSAAAPFLPFSAKHLLALPTFLKKRKKKKDIKNTRHC